MHTYNKKVTFLSVSACAWVCMTQRITGIGQNSNTWWRQSSGLNIEWCNECVCLVLKKMADRSHLLLWPWLWENQGAHCCGHDCVKTRVPTAVTMTVWKPGCPLLWPWLCENQGAHCCDHDCMKTRVPTAVTMTMWKPGYWLSALLQVPLGSRMTCRCSYRKWCRRLTASLSDCPLQGRGVYVGQLGGDEWLTEGEGQMFLLARAQPLLAHWWDNWLERERGRERDRQTDGQRNRERDRQTDRETEGGGGGSVCTLFFKWKRKFRCIFCPLKTDSSDTLTISLILRPYLGEYGWYACGESLFGEVIKVDLWPCVACMPGQSCWPARGVLLMI